MGFARNYACNLGALATGREPSRPLLFSYYVTHRCPLHCTYCSDGKGRPFSEDRVRELALPEIDKLLKTLRPSGDTLDITGGEPLMRQDLEEILAAAREHGFRVVLNTKGIGLRVRPGLFGLVDVLVFSVDALEPARLASLLGGSTARAAEILSLLSEATSMTTSTTCRVVLAAVATPENLTDVRAVLEYALDRDWGFQVSPQLVGTRVHPGLVDNAAFRELIARVREAKQERIGVLGVDTYLRRLLDFSVYRCHPMLMPTIRPDGKMPYPCLERPEALVDLLVHERFDTALREARCRAPDALPCDENCQIFCHMALSLLQRHPCQALGEQRHWRGSGSARRKRYGTVCSSAERRDSAVATSDRGSQP
jgi:MoaA/NifB/PqqE/SkfB family radical SAM enzyme